MHYVKQFDINGVATKQVACIELHGKPNAATEGYVGVLGIDVVSPLHEVYKCVAVNGSIYSWELLSSGLSIMSATISGGGAVSVQFPYDNIKKPATYIIKRGDLLLDREGYLYSIDALNTTYCEATYTGTQVAAYGFSAYDLAVQNGFDGSTEEWLESLKIKGDKGDEGDSAYEVAVKKGFKGSEEEWLESLKVKGDEGDTPYIGENGHWWIAGVDTMVNADKGVEMKGGYYNGTNSGSLELIFPFVPKVIFIIEKVKCYVGNTEYNSDALGVIFPEKGRILRIELVDTGEVSLTVNETGVSVSLNENTVALVGSANANALGNMPSFSVRAMKNSQNAATEADGYGYWYYAFGSYGSIDDSLATVETALDDIIEAQNSFIGEE